MFTKFILLVLLSISIIQVSKSRVIRDDILQKAREEIDELQKIIQDYVDDALPTIKQYESSIDDKVQTAEASFTTSFINLFNKSRDEIQKKADEAIQQGFNVTDCLLDSEQSFATLNVSLTQEEQDGIASTVQETTNVTESAYNNINSQTDIISTLNDRLTACNSDENCLQTLINDVEKLKTDIPDDIAGKERDAFDAVSQLDDAFILLKTIVMGDSKIQVKLVVKATEICITNKMKL